MQILKKITIYTLISFFIITPVSASTLSLQTSKLEHGSGEMFAVVVLLDDVEACVNTAEVKVKFPKDELMVQDFLVGGSLINFWIERPGKTEFFEANKNGELVFSGGIPGGYCGKIPGDPGNSNQLAKIVFKVLDIDIEKDIQIYLEDSRILLNDGLGTADDVSTTKINLSLKTQDIGNSEDYIKDLLADNIWPEPFVVELRQDENIFNGQYYIIFSTVDKQSGIDLYEVLEIRQGEKVGEAPHSNLIDKLGEEGRDIVGWKTAKTPYLLTDQTLQSEIRVRAIDKAGNKRLISFFAPEVEKDKVKSSSYKDVFVVLFIVGVGVILLIAIIILVRKIHAKNNKEDQI